MAKLTGIVAEDWVIPGSSGVIATSFATPLQMLDERCFLAALRHSRRSLVCAMVSSCGGPVVIIILLAGIAFCRGVFAIPVSGYFGTVGNSICPD